MNLHLSLALIFDAVLAATCLFSLIWGGRPERIGATINLTASMLTTLLRLLDQHFFAPADPIIFAIDISVLAGFFWLAIRSTRFWPVWAFGFALADIVLSVAGPLLPANALFAFHTGLGIYAYLALLAMTTGTIALLRRARRDPGSEARSGWRVDPNSPS